MYSELRNNLALAILSYKIINIYVNGEKIVIGDGGVSKNDVSFRPFGFYIKDCNCAFWYNYSCISKIEVFGHEL